MLPSINAVGAKLFTLRVYHLRLLMQLHLIAWPMIAFAPCAHFAEAAVAGTIMPDNSDIGRLQEPNPLLYRCFPLTCARSQE
jgi:hypothetical protein